MKRRKGASSSAQQRYMRKMERRLRQLDRADARARAAGRDPYEDWLRNSDSRGPRELPAPPRPRRAHGALRTIAIICLALAIPAALVYLVGLGSRGDSTTTASTSQLHGYPPAGYEEQDSPIGQPQQPPAATGPFSYINTQPGSDDPVRWDPCRPIHYATAGIAPAKGQELLASAFGHVSDITGFKFINDGPTGEPVDQLRPVYQPDRYGERWAPILVAWTTPQEIPKLTGDTVGLGGATAVSTGSSRLTYISGTLFLDRPQIMTILDAAARHPDLTTNYTMLRAIMLHELGHVIGLDHVDDPTQLMYPEARPQVTDYGAGDKHGLYTLSTGACVPNL